MGSQGVPIAVDEINKAGGFKVGDTTYKLELIALDTRGDPKEATIQLKKLLEQDKVRFVFGPFLSNVFVTVLPYAKQFNGKFLMMGGGTRMHDFVGTPDHDFVIRTWNWDAGPKGFGERMVDYLIKTAGPKKVAMLFQNDQGGKVLGEIYEPHLQGQGHRNRDGVFRAGHQGLHAGAGQDRRIQGRLPVPRLQPTRRSTTSCGSRPRATSSASSSWCAALWAPGMKNKDGIDDYIVYVPKDFEEAEKTEPKVKHFVDAYKAFYKRDFPYDQAPLCSSSCYDHVYMLVAAMQKAGTVDDVGQDPRRAAFHDLQGMWTISFDDHAEQVFDFDIVHLKKGGASRSRKWCDDRADLSMTQVVVGQIPQRHHPRDALRHYCPRRDDDVRHHRYREFRPRAVHDDRRLCDLVFYRHLAMLPYPARGGARGGCLPPWPDWSPIRRCFGSPATISSTACWSRSV